MKRLPTLTLAASLLLAAAVLAAGPPPPPGGGTAPAADGTTRVVLENVRVRAHRIDYPAGARVPLHRHAHPRVVVALAGGTLEFRGEDGVVKRLEVAAGEVVWRPAESHSIVNAGQTTVSLVEIDVLDCDQNSRDM